MAISKNVFFNQNKVKYAGTKFNSIIIHSFISGIHSFRILAFGFFAKSVFPCFFLFLTRFMLLQRAMVKINGLFYLYKQVYVSTYTKTLNIVATLFILSLRHLSISIKYPVRKTAPWKFFLCMSRDFFRTLKENCLNTYAPKPILCTKIYLFHKCLVTSKTHAPLYKMNVFSL